MGTYYIAMVRMWRDVTSGVTVAENQNGVNLVPKIPQLDDCPTSLRADSDAIGEAHGGRTSTEKQTSTAGHRSGSPVEPAIAYLLSVQCASTVEID
jgi:hypothetical protein